ncbi:tRNA (guanine-N(7)-)-methyltransferase [Lactococcus hodotermopsidis]|uniref:tRNA (guanine-N(7)-)-methyltransferase n=1 Tax=Pseudolactococcus hodotermopsidis TaxID=2709157 RepID=A0A6A0BE52_9LACT|nr:tRNA (guanosine(46)-N7)-methyltransferase TrmB [Lactococcus hodotermopsidis]GFH42973.1 tRNA (guanine-N(7)-)-methyltransferase [Lactococcus hodotermopsidis]
MRVRNRKGAPEMMAENPQYVVENPEMFKGKWAEKFGNRHPIHIEVGSGKGAFITGMAQLHPEINYIAIDMQLTVLSYALDKVLALNLPNVQLLHVDGSALTNYFADGEVALVYLNFSDPWPKLRHEKRRLTYKDFLKNYETILVEQGQIHFKTDNCGLFEYSLASMSQYGMILQQVWLDLHADDTFSEKNVMTEYEAKFSSKGQVIYRVEAQFCS